MANDGIDTEITTLLDGFNTSQNATDKPAFTSFYPTISTWAHIVETVFLSSVIAIGVPGNLLLIAVQVKNKKKTSTDYLLMIMAMYELVCCSLNSSMKLLKKVDYIYVDLMGSSFKCRFSLFITKFTNIGSAQMLGAIAVDRYIKMCWPLSTFYGEFQACVVSGVILVVSTVLCLPFLAMIDWSDKFRDCIFNHVRLLSPYLYSQGLNSIFFIVLFAITFSYTKIHIAMRRRFRNKKMTRRYAVERSNTRSELSSTTHVTEMAHDQTDQVSNVKILVADASNSQMTHDQSNSQSTNVGNLGSNQLSDISRTIADTDTNPQNGSCDGNSGTESAHTTGVSNGNSDAPVANKPVSVVFDARSSEKKEHLDGVDSSVTSSQKKGKPLKKATSPASTEGRTLNKLTVTMLLISLVYIVTGLANWITFIMPRYSISFDMIHLSFSLPFINCITNPVLLFTMSKKFSGDAKRLLCG